MNFIIFDLEWNTVFDKKQKKHLGEIVEIGAVKLNENFELIGEFSETIKPRINAHLKKRTTKLTGIKDSDLINSKDFVEVTEVFQTFAGDIEENVFLSWSDSDIRTFSENFNYHFNDSKIPFINYYVDLQEYFMKNLKIVNSDQISLQNALDMFNIKCDKSKLHRAVNDAALSAECFKKVFDESNFNKFIKILDEKFYNRLTFVPFYVNDINSPLIDKNIFKSKCIFCGRELKNMDDWKFKHNYFVNKALCENCNKGYFIRISYKKFYDKLNCSKQIKEI